MDVLSLCPNMMPGALPIDMRFRDGTLHSRNYRADNGFILRNP